MFNQNAYGQYASSSNTGGEPLAFYQGGSNYGGYSGQQNSAMGSMGSMSGGGYASGNMASGRISTSEGRWWEAFGTGGLEGEPSLMEGECWWTSCGRNRGANMRRWEAAATPARSSCAPTLLR